MVRAGISFAWLLAPEAFWERLGSDVQDRAAAWMLQINDQPPSDNNWLLFRVLVNLALARLGREWSRPVVEAALERLDDFYLGEGWYRDGARHQIDYYVPMAFRFYGLVLRSVVAMAERHSREHQSSGPKMAPEEARHPGGLRLRIENDLRPPQRDTSKMPRMEDTGRGVPRKDDGRDGTIPLPSQAVGVAVQVSLTL